MSSSVKDLREKGGQHLIVLAAPKAQLSVALLGARIAKGLFAKNNVMVAPVVLRDAVQEALDAQLATGPKGFGKVRRGVSQVVSVSVRGEWEGEVGML